MMWQPISAAPQTVPILGAWRNAGRWVVKQMIYEAGKWRSAETGGLITPTYWAPLPVGP